MATIKSFTDLQQSKKLAEILPLESADMFWLVLGNTPRVHVLTEPLSNYSHWESYPCWSLAALLDVLQKAAYSIDEDANVVLCSYKTVEWNVGINNSDVEFITKTNPVDACVEMILKLHELKML